MPTDPLLKYKEHERERYRERRVRAIMDDKKNRYGRRLANLQRWEIQKQKERQREAQRLQDLTLAKLREQMIEDDLAFSEGEEEEKRRADPQAYGKWLEERKRIFNRER